MRKTRFLNNLKGYMFLLPLVIGLLIFRVYGFINNVYLSFTESGAIGPSEFIGFENYNNLFSDSQFLLSITNTLRFVLICIPLILIISISSAVLLNKEGKIISIFRIIYFMPAVILPVAIIQVIMWLFNTDYGLINYILNSSGFDKIPWFSSEATVTFIIVLSIVFINISIPTFIILSGLKDIPNRYYEAATIDGASKTKQFFRITLPLLTPSIFYVLITSGISLFQIFDEPYVMFQPEKGGIGINYAKTIVYYYYQHAFQYSNGRGYASAISIALLIIIISVTAILFKTQNRWVKYDR